MSRPNGRSVRAWFVAVIAAALAATVLGGCAAMSRPTRPAAISHVVFVKLKNAAEAPALIADSDRLLPAIPGVVSYACGRHLDTGRTNIDGNYDVGLYVGFDDEAGYRTYVDHPNHVQLVNTWRSKWEWIRIHDVRDSTP
ncbi:MAG: Dabb family protein [Phycisphaerales bacterium]